MSLKNIQWNNVQRTLMGGFQIHRAGLAGGHGGKPCACTDAPTVAGVQTGKIELRRWCDQIVSLFFCKL